MSRVRRCAIGLGWLIGLFLTSPTWAKVQFVPLGFVPGATVNSSTAQDVSADGHWIAGDGITSSGSREVTRWQAEGGYVSASALGDLPGSVTFSLGFGISDDGTSIVGRGSSASGTEAFRWTNTSGISSLGDLPGGGVSSGGNDVSADGSVNVGYVASTSGFEAFRWTPSTGMIGLGLLAGGSESVAQGVSSDGTVVVGRATDSFGSTQAFRWQGGVMTGLGYLPDAYFNHSEAHGVSSDGTVVVGVAVDSGAVPQAFYSTGTGLIPLGVLPGDNSSVAYAASGDGSVIVGRSANFPAERGFIWDQVHGMRDIKSFLTSAGAAVSGWQLSSVTSISDDGRTIVGSGVDPNGSSQAWLAYLSQDVDWTGSSSPYWDQGLNWTGPTLPMSGDNVTIRPSGPVELYGPSNNASMGTLTLANAGSGRTRLVVGSANLTVAGTADIQAGGELALAAGRTLVASTIQNAGIISGTGNLAGSFQNLVSGEVRLGTGDQLAVSGIGHTNNGTIEVLGGDFETLGSLTNAGSTGLITGRDATLRLESGLSNNGAVALTGGVNDVSGDITNSAGGTITITGGAAAVFYDDVTQNGTLRVRKVGSTNSTAVFLGAFTGSGGSTGGGDIFFEGDLRPGNSPASVTFDNNVGFSNSAQTMIELAGTTVGTQYDRINVTGELSLDGALVVSLLSGFTPTAGNSFDILHWGTLVGTFDALALPSLTSGLAWNTSQLYTTGTLTVGLAGDFNLDGTVDAADFTVWRDGLGGVYTAADYDVWRANFGATASGSLGNTTTSVPEPASFPLLLATLGLILKFARLRPAC